MQIIHGTRDILVDKEWIDRIGSALPEPPRRVLLDAMHSPNIDQPGLLAEPVLAFLRENLRVKRYR
ncbi:hypothetical protein CZ771_02320 [Actinomycetales bacterium JB111]|nr:hypothetical protein CZ771_02320 [Actinomycetales bacterium JB111]